MKKIFLFAVIITIFAAFFASTHPDGLDFVAENFGFNEKGIERSAPMPNYSLNFLPQGQVSTALAGMAGILVILAIFCLAIYLLKKRETEKINHKMLFLLFLMSLTASPVFAARPLITDDFYTVAQGEYELEMGYASIHDQPGIVHGLSLSFKRGIFPKFDLGIEVPYTTTDPSGLNDILLHAKYRLFEKNEDEGLTARIDFKFNNGNISHGLGSGDNDCWGMLIYSKMFGQTKTHLNLGYVNVGINAGTPTDDYIAYTFAMEHPAWGEKGDIVAEYVGDSAAIPNPAFIQIGARYLVAPKFKIDAAYAIGLNKNSIKNSVTAGIHWEF